MVASDHEAPLMSVFHIEKSAMYPSLYTVLRTPWKTNMEPENQPLAKGDSEFGNHHFQVLC